MINFNFNINSCFLNSCETWIEQIQKCSLKTQEKQRNFVVSKSKPHIVGKLKNKEISKRIFINLRFSQKNKNNLHRNTYILGYLANILVS